METSSAHRKRVIIVGGGFAGLNLARELLNTWHYLLSAGFYEVTIIDKNNYNFFTPLLYQVATSFLDPSSICYPFRKLFRDMDITFRMATVQKVDSSKNRVMLGDGGELVYDFLVFAAGTGTNFFDNESIRQFAYTIKDVDDALFFRNELIRKFERASLEKDPAEKQSLLTIVVAGGGPTGVELAGMFAEMKKYILGRDYPELQDASMEIYVIDHAPDLLSAMSEKTHEEAFRALTESGVHVKLNTKVVLYEKDTVHLSDGDTIGAKTLVWAAGVIANTFEGISEKSLGKGKRMITDALNRVQGYDNIFAIGDISIQFGDTAYPDGHPQLAQPAIQQGKTVGKNLIRLAKGHPMRPFKYADRGEMAIIGRRLAVADLFKHKLHLSGLPGLASWLFIHLISLVNYNNKIKTFYNWAVAYLTQDQALRMVFRSGSRESRRP